MDNPPRFKGDVSNINGVSHLEYPAIWTNKIVQFYNESYWKNFWLQCHYNFRCRDFFTGLMDENSFRGWRLTCSDGYTVVSLIGPSLINLFEGA